jgi:hypothetical protein
MSLSELAQCTLILLVMKMSPTDAEHSEIIRHEVPMSPSESGHSIAILVEHGIQQSERVHFVTILSAPKIHHSDPMLSAIIRYEGIMSLSVIIAWPLIL